MNDQDIYRLMAKTPDIRAVQIADALDKDLSDVSEALRSLVDVGDVVRHSGRAPNGQPCQLYNLSADFKRSKTGVELLAAVAGFAEPAAPVVDQAPPAPAPPPPVETPVFSQQTEMPPKPTKAQLAIEHLTAHAKDTDPHKLPVGDRAMCVALGLPSSSNPKAYLTAHLKSGAIVRDENKHWRLGDGTPPPKPGSSPPMRTYSATKDKGPVAQFAPTAQPDPAPAPSDPHPEIAHGYEREDYVPPASPPADLVTPSPFDDRAPAPTTTTTETTMPDTPDTPAPPAAAETGAALPPPTEPPVFRCGLWSDGVLELQRNGVQVVALNRGEHEHLADFMGRMLARVDSDPGKAA